MPVDQPKAHHMGPPDWQPSTFQKTAATQNLKENPEWSEVNFIS